MADFVEGMSSDPQVRQSTKRGGEGIDVVECRRNIDPTTEGSVLLCLFDAATDAPSSGASTTRSSLLDAVLLRFNDGRTYPFARLEPEDISRSATCDMLSSGVTSESKTVGRLCRRDELVCLERLLSEGRRSYSSPRDSSVIASSPVDGLEPYTYSSVLLWLSLTLLSVFSVSSVSSELLLCFLFRCLRSFVAACLELETAGLFALVLIVDVDLLLRSAGVTL